MFQCLYTEIHTHFKLGHDMLHTKTMHRRHKGKGGLRESTISGRQRLWLPGSAVLSCRKACGEEGIKTKQKTKKKKAAPTFCDGRVDRASGKLTLNMCVVTTG